MESELQYNLTKNRLVPKAVKMEKEKVEDFKKKFGVKFPTMFSTDPLSRFMNYMKGDIIKIYRADGLHYRIVK